MTKSTMINLEHYTSQKKTNHAKQHSKWQEADHVYRQERKHCSSMS